MRIGAIGEICGCLLNDKRTHSNQLISAMKKESMTSRERVEATVKGLPVDRIPVMYWLNPHAACKMLSEYRPGQNLLWNFLGRRFWKWFGRDKGFLSRDTRNSLPLLQHVYANRDYVLELGADMANQAYGTKKYWLTKSYRENGSLRVVDGFGSLRKMGGIYLDVIEPAIKDIEDIKNFKFPDASGDENYAAIRKFRDSHPDTCVFVDNFGVQDLPSTNIWEMSQLMMALYDYPDEMKEFQRRFADHMIDVAQRSVKAGADIVFIYDDYGYTGRPLISMDMWKEFTFPHLKRQIEAVHDAGAIAMLHSCGFQMPFLPYYIEAELDILQSFQPGAENDFEQAYGEFGSRLTFNTGIDVQQGEAMTPAQLKEDILRSYRIGGRNGRHILGMSHMMQYTMPLENIQTLFATVQEIQSGVYD